MGTRFFSDGRFCAQKRTHAAMIRSHAAPLILLLTSACTAFAQSAPSTDQASASVEGVVINAATGDPVPRAHVQLTAFTRGKQRSFGAMTTPEGKFSISGLSAGDYGISANRLGFVPGPGGGPNGFVLKQGDNKDDLTLKLTPTGAIAGTVLDADGEPVENCAVWAGNLGSSSDAQGRFRIGGLSPGKYQVRAAPDEPQTPPEARTDGTAEVHYSETYYPGALDVASGAVIVVEPGSEAGGNEIRLVRTPLVRVSGKVTGIPQDTENVSLVVQRVRESKRLGSVARHVVSSSFGGAVKKDGTFALWRLAPGSYRISAHWNSPSGRVAASAPADFVVGDSNIDAIELPMLPAADLTGQMEYENDDARPPAPAEATKPARRRGPQVVLQGIDGSNASFVSAPVDANGAFIVEKVEPGRYHVMWTGARGYVKSIRHGGTETAGDVLDLNGGAAGQAVTMVISVQYGSVSGTVQSDGAPVDGLRVLLLPGGVEMDGWMGMQQLGRIAASGSYLFDSLRPGTYTLAAVATDDLEAILQGENAADAYSSVTETVTIAAGDQVTQDLKVLKPQQ